MAKAKDILDAVYLIDDKVMNARRDIQSGWDLDDRGSNIDFFKDWCCRLSTDKSIPYGVSAKRDFLTITHGKASYEGSFRLEKGDGFYITFYSEENNKVLEIIQKDGFFFANGTQLDIKAQYKYYCIGVEFDLDSKTADISFDGEFSASVSLFANTLSRLKMGYGADAQGSAELLHNHLHINFLVNDMVQPVSEGNLDYRWKCDVKNGASLYRHKYYEEKIATYIAKTENDGGYAKAQRNFEKTDGKVCFQIKYLTENIGASVKLSMMCGDKTVVSVTDDGEKCCDSKGRLLRSHSKNVWQTARIEADFSEGKALYIHNGKKCGYIEFENSCTFADGIAAEYQSCYDSIMKFREITVFPINPEPEDYVPEPIMPKKLDYYLGMNVCSLWRTGEQWGWDLISPFYDNKTYLGWYDEGLAEVSDWEIKWMAEHGLDFQMFCWFSNQKDAPICTPFLSSALHEGYFNAKYSDKVKFTIIWEAMNCAHPDREAFRKYVVPFWIDYYFTDPRYMTIENKLVVSIFGTAALIRDFGSVEAVKEEFEYLRSVAKELGFDGIIFISPGENGLDREFEYMGLDAFYAYNLGKGGYDENQTKKSTLSSIERRNKHYVPTVSTGFNNVAWADTRSPVMTPKTLENVLEWFKSDILPKAKGEDWKRKLVAFSTWNEYGEGTYICPSNVHGFGYLDAMRKAFTTEKEEHTDLRPTENQLDRICYLYPKDRKPLRSQLLVKEPLEVDVKKTVYFCDLLKEDKISCVNGVNIRIEKGSVIGSSKEYDPFIYWQTEDLDASQVSAIRVTMKSWGISEEEPEGNFPYNSARMFFLTEGESEWSEARGNINMEVSDDGQSIYFPFDDVAQWTGKITALRLNPLKSACRFVLEKLEYLRKKDVYTMTVDGKTYKPFHNIKMLDGEIYFPFDPHAKFCTLAKLYYEWNDSKQTLFIDCKGKNIYFTAGKDSVTVDGKQIKLERKLEIFDSLPMLPLRVFCEITGFTAEIEGYNIKLNTNN